MPKTKKVLFVPLTPETWVPVTSVVVIRAEDDGTFSVTTDLQDQYYFASESEMKAAFRRSKEVAFGAAPSKPRKPRKLPKLPSGRGGSRDRGLA